jgi:hypothetical protein
VPRSTAVYVFPAANAGLAPAAGSVGVSSDVHAAIPSAIVAESRVISLTGIPLPPTHERVRAYR